MKPSIPVTTDVVLIGGGHSHVAVLKAFGMRPQPGVRLTLVARDVLTPYSGMLPGLVAGHYSHAEAHVDLQRLCRFAGARLFHAAASGIDPAAREVCCTWRPPVSYDLLSIDIGSTPALDAIEGASAHAIGVKPVDQFLARWPAVEAQALQAGGRLRIVVIGGGAGGVELTLSMQHRLAQALAAAGVPDEVRFTIVSETERLLPTHAPGVGAYLAAIAAARGIRVVAGTRVSAIGPDRVHCESGEEIGCEVAIAVTHAAPAPWLAESGLALDQRGFVRVSDTLQSISHPEVFASGDVATMESNRLSRPLPKSGVYAVRQGPVLAENLRRAARGRRLQRYRPQTRTLALISSGDANAVVSYGRFSVAGRWVWRAKDWIDRRWMRRYQELPRMPGQDDGASADPLASPEAAGALAMRCGGCGSKVASAVLHRVLERLESAVHRDVLVGLERADDAAVIEVPAGKLLVQSVDHFRTFIDDPYLFARVTTNHCLSDLFAMGASPHTAQVLVSLPYGPERKVEQDLLLVLRGVCETLDDAGAVLVGGHTAEGPELSLGLAVNGLVEHDRVLSKGGMQPGDQLVLTKALGTGVIFAADMRAQASAAWVQNALGSMLQSNQAAVECLLRYGATACTDVTGFGLAGHLVEMLRASAASAVLQAGRIPLLSGTAELLAAGVRSSLQPANEAFAAQVDLTNGHAAATPALFDPQTSGGLLASVPATRVRACLRRLRVLGYTQACCIGEVQAVDLGAHASAADSLGRIKLQ